MESMPPRYAIYYVPEKGSSLERLGSSLLGRSVYTGEALPQPRLGDIFPEDFFSLTRDARRYGLHATAKPPFFLKNGVREEDLLQAVEHFAYGRRALFLPALAVSRIGSFFALIMNEQTEEEAEAAENVRLAAHEAVAFFDVFRAPSSEEDMARRRTKGLTPRQEDYLCRWGYPYVFDEFRFHITLTDAVREPERALAIENALRGYMASALEGNRLDAVALCRSDAEGAFTVLRQVSFSPDKQF